MNLRNSTAPSRKAMVSFGVAALLAVTAAAAQVANGDAAIDTTGNYQHEVQACMTGSTQQDRDTCLKEARNARAEKQRGTLESDAGREDRNAMARCDVLAGEEKAACHARILGFGNTSGSVAGGGVLREVETVVVPPGQGPVTIEPKTADPVLLVPAK